MKGKNQKRIRLFSALGLFAIAIVASAIGAVGEATGEVTSINGCPGSICTEPMLECLFVDASGCSEYCPPGTRCVTESATCILGFGADASCDCVICPKITGTEIRYPAHVFPKN